MMMQIFGRTLVTAITLACAVPLAACGGDIGMNGMAGKPMELLANTMLQQVRDHAGDGQRTHAADFAAGLPQSGLIERRHFAVYTFYRTLFETDSEGGMQSLPEDEQAVDDADGDWGRVTCSPFLMPTPKAGGN
jgi:hypothetical protein